MLFHKKEKAPEGQQAGAKPEKPRKVRWSERREPSEAGLERFQDYLQTYSTNKDHPIKILCSFYKGKQKKLVETGFFLILQRSPDLDHSDCNEQPSSMRRRIRMQAPWRSSC